MMLRRIFPALLFCSPLPISAYEIGTHAYVTKAAVDASVLAPTHPRSIVPVLSFNRLDSDKPFEAIFEITGLPEPSYFDNEPLPAISLESIDASELHTRDPQNIEGNIFAALIARNLLPAAADRQAFEQRIDAWVMRGAVREDDNDFLGYSIGDRDEDPWGNVFRAGRHFFDPINNRALDNDLACIIAAGCVRSTEWALGRTGALAAGGTLDPARRNHFSWQDARDNYWWALTYNLRLDEESGMALSHGYVQNVESGFRKFRFATTLKSIGQVIHLVQDAAQPQHARNDSHGPPTAQVLTGDAPADGAYEAFTEARLFRDLGVNNLANPLTHFDGTPPSVEDLPILRLSGSTPYPVPSFSTPVEYFTTPETDAVLARRGLADLSNRGFFTSSTLPVNVDTGKPDTGAAAFDDPPLPLENPSFYQEIQTNTALYYESNIIVKEKILTAVVPDVLAPNWNQQSGFFTEYGGDGRLPLLAASQTSLADDLLTGTPLPGTESVKYSMSYEVFTAQADAMLPRAVAYSTGMIDYFFRGRLEITPNTQQVFAVLNQGEPHTVDAEGYPRKDSDNTIFGFEKVRLKVRNVTDAIVESGPVTTPIPQTSANGTLVAVARYHRNACYKRDMSGERHIGYAPPPAQGAITEPSCGGLAQRTDYPEISVSEPITISSAADLPGGQGSGGPAAVDKTFDFSDDPIPVNATDLFIQVVYRGQLGDEPDGIAVGSYDVREPTFVGIVNNTDFYWNPGNEQWVAQTPNGPFPQKNMDVVRACVGGSWAYHGFVDGGLPPLGFPAPNPGVIRLAMIFAKPPNATQQFGVRVTPVVFGGGPSPDDRIYLTRGQQHQANKERIETSVLNAALICTETAPTATAYWCNTPIKKRRGQPLGEVVAMVTYVNGFGTPDDTDALPLPVFPGVDLTTTGTIKYNDAMLSNCPAAPTASANAKAQSL